MLRMSFVLLVGAALLIDREPAKAQDGERVVPVHLEPRHRMVFDAGMTKILHPQLYPGDVSLWHTHAEAIFTVTFGSSTMRTQNAGAPWMGAGIPFTKPGLMLSSVENVKQPLTHRVENVGKTLFELIAVLNTTAGDSTQSPQAAGFDGTAESADDWFRGYRLALAAAQTAKHRHAAPVVIVQVGPGRGVASGERTFGLNGPTSWAYFDAQEPHELRNSGRGAIDLVEIEVRQPRK